MARIKPDISVTMRGKRRPSGHVGVKGAGKTRKVKGVSVTPSFKLGTRNIQQPKKSIEASLSVTFKKAKKRAPKKDVATQKRLALLRATRRKKKS